jgi:hypothetical protein
MNEKVIIPTEPIDLVMLEELEKLEQDICQKENEDLDLLVYLTL